jgi:hypothetical protein
VSIGPGIPRRRRACLIASWAIGAWILAAGLLGPAHAGAAEIIQKGDLRLTLEGELTPHSLPREAPAAVGVSVGAKIATTDGTDPPQLRRFTIAINRYGKIDYQGLRACTIPEIQPSTTALAREACGASLVGTGTFSANVELAHQSPFPSEGRVLAFFGRVGGKPAILAHVYGTDPIPTSYTLPLLISEHAGQFRTVLSASLPSVTEDWGFVTGLELNLRRSFFWHGARHSFLSASCPAPKGFPGAVFPFLKTIFGFAKRTLSETLTRNCGVRGG